MCGAAAPTSLVPELGSEVRGWSRDEDIGDKGYKVDFQDTEIESQGRVAPSEGKVEPKFPSIQLSQINSKTRPRQGQSERPP